MQLEKYSVILASYFLYFCEQKILLKVLNIYNIFNSQSILY